MAHHRHFVQTGLAIKNHEVVVLQMAFDHISVFEQLVRSLLQKCKVKLFSVEAADELGAWPLVWTVFNELLEICAILRSYDLRDRHIHRDVLGHTELVERQVGVASNDGSGCKVTSLSHEILPETTFLALQSLTNGL